MADISYNFCINKLVKLFHFFLESLVSYTSDCNSILIPPSQFLTDGFLTFFLLIPTLGAFSLLLPAKFHPWNSVSWRLALSRVAPTPLTAQSCGWTAFLCVCVAFFGSQTRSSPVLEADVIDEPLHHLFSWRTHLSHSGILYIYMPCTKPAVIKVFRLYFVANSLGENRHNPQFTVFYKA